MLDKIWSYELRKYLCCWLYITVHYQVDRSVAAVPEWSSGPYSTTNERTDCLESPGCHLLSEAHAHASRLHLAYSHA